MMAKTPKPVEALSYEEAMAELETIVNSLEEGNQKLEEAHESLLELKRVTKSVYMDVREGIFNLRSTASTVVGFFPTLRAYLNEYREHYGLDVRIEAYVDPEIETMKYHLWELRL